MEKMMQQLGTASKIEEYYQLCLLASDQVKEVYRSFAGEFWEKEDESPVTRADLLVDRLFRKHLAKITPELPVVSEESLAGRSSFEHGEIFWLLDPLDGTKEFLKRNGQFTINLALMYQDTPVLGIVAVPMEQRVYWAVRKQGSFVQGPGQARERLQVATMSWSPQQMKVLVSQSHLSAQEERLLAWLKAPQVEKMGSSLKLLRVAEGKAHLYPRFFPTKEWDTAACQVIVEEAGGVVWTGFQEPLSYPHHPDWKNPPFIAFGKISAADENQLARLFEVFF